MGLFRRSRPVHERLAEQGDLDIGQEVERRPPSRLAALLHGLTDGFLTSPPDEFGRPHPLGEVAIHGVPRARRWDAVASAAAELPGEAVHFVALPDGTLLVDEDLPDGALAPLADAIEATLAPPYRAEAVRREAGLWAVAASRIRVEALPDEEEDELERVEDGRIVRGSRLDGDLFELDVSPL